MTDPGFVYLVQSGEDYRFKIGRTVNLPRRMRSLQLGSPTPLHLVGWQRTPDPVVHEKQWHKNMGISRRHGEWFDLSLKQLRLFREYANAFYRMERQPWPADMEKSLFLSVGDGHLIEVEVVQIEHTEELWGLILVEAVTTEMVGGEEHAVLFDPHMPRTTFPESSFQICSDEISNDPRGALLYHPQEWLKYSSEDQQLHKLCEQEMGHRHG
jgi:hypothetical protein